jgi:3-methylcrotonyl-CoA carboxylase alpha subunit
LSGARAVALPLDADGESVTAAVAYRAGRMEVAVDGVAPASDARTLDADAAVFVLRHGRQTVVRLKALDVAEAAGAAAGGRVTAPMHGKVLEVLVAPGAAVRKGDRLAVIEAMKMEHTLLAPIDGIVADVRVTVSAQVAQGAHLMTIEPE